MREEERRKGSERQRQRNREKQVRKRRERMNRPNAKTLTTICILEQVFLIRDSHLFILN